ncbi:MAG: prepilin-type N-terminal cleavage/methylation domain-containing protein [Candidatus Omnitrophica bacterium]|nr:prepilin-type N-terminal cleavage/methylation domain-containing protein [Candidatus Omnitrophota bacterium]
MNKKYERGFGLIELLIVLALVALVYYLMNKVSIKKGPGGQAIQSRDMIGAGEAMRYDKVYDAARKQIDKVKAQSSSGDLE